MVTDLLAAQAGRTGGRAIAVTAFLAGFAAALGVVALDQALARMLGLR